MNRELTTAEKLLQHLIDQWDATPYSELKIDLSQVNAMSDVMHALTAQIDEVGELNKLVEKLDAENGKLAKRIAELETGEHEWQLTIRQLQDQMDKMRRETVHLDRVRDVLNMAMFAIEAVIRANENSHQIDAVLRGIVNEARSELIFGSDDDLPF